MSLKQKSVSYLKKIANTLEIQEELVSSACINLLYGIGKDYRNHTDSLYNHLVTSGFPIEFSMMFCKSGRRSLRFTIEPGSHIKVSERQKLIENRFIRLLDNQYMSENIKTFKTITSILYNTNTSLKWFCHFGFEFTNNINPKLKIYFAPVFDGILVGKNLAKRQLIMDSKEAIKITVLNLLEEFDLGNQTKDFLRVYEIINNKNEDKNENFITFIAADFEKDQSPKFKIYFNPNIK